MDTMMDNIDRQKLITVVGSFYPEYIVPHLMEKAFEPYQQTDFSRRRFQTSVWEHGHATAAILLTATGIEAYRNRIYYIEKEDIGQSDVVDDLCRMLHANNAGFPDAILRQVLNEVFVIRNVIAHNHIYEVEVWSDKYLTMLRHKQKLLKGYRRDRKYRSSVKPRSRKTNLIRLNVQPAKIGFEDLFKVLVVFDLLVGVTQSILSPHHVPHHIHYNIDDRYIDNLAELLTYYLEIIPNKRFVNELEGLSGRLRLDFGPFLKTNRGLDWFVTNICPKCSTLGFSKTRFSDSCRKCGLRIGSLRI